MDDTPMSDDAMGRLESKIDGLRTGLEGKIDAVGTGLNALDRKVDALAMSVNGKIDLLAAAVNSTNTRLTKVETRLTQVETTLTHVEKTLTEVHVLADQTAKFANNAWDSLTSLERRMTEGFDAAKKERKAGFALVHAAIRDWGGRVETLDAKPTRATKRRR